MEPVFRCGDREFVLGKRTYLVGVLNITPDSFSDGGRFLDPEVAVDHAKAMVEAGADILDIGGESSRPGAEPISARQEMERVLPVLDRLAGQVDVPLCIDTYKSEVAREAIGMGVTMVNDISGLRASPDMVELVAREGVSVIIMHMKGMPRDMQKDPRYDDVMGEISDFLGRQAKVAIDAGVPRDRMILDPGIGFGKTLDHNLEILARVGELRELGYPILIGTSRKSFIGDLLGTGPDDRLEGTLASKVVAIMGGVDLIRAHDVKEVSRAMVVTDRIMRGR